ncbi:transposase [Sporosarcina sp. FSL K6-1522]|uniref:transposase n=1 Tax=Sporosarcina sp. FSL K6-1522 TaxID=2921554 RepID=UPI00315A7E0A
MKYDIEFKEMVAQEAIDTNNISATAKKYGVNTNSVSKWKKELEKKLGMGEIQKTNELGNDKEVTLYKREVLELKKRLEITKSELNEAMTIIGEKDLYIKKLERSLSK